MLVKSFGEGSVRRDFRRLQSAWQEGLDLAASFSPLSRNRFGVMCYKKNLKSFD
jgi:hypothetical protein